LAVVFAIACSITSISGAALASGSMPGVRPDGTDPTAWGWVTDRLPTTVDYLVPGGDGKDQVGTEPSIERRSFQGGPVYWVTYPNARNIGKVATFATALSSGRVVCGIQDPPGPNDVQEVAICADSTGHLVNSRFSAMFISVADSPSGRIAYLFASDPSQTDYTPAGANYNAFGMPNRVHKIGTGRWLVALPFYTTPGGTVQLTADNGVGVCRAVRWIPVPTDGVAHSHPSVPTGEEDVYVTCRSYTGALLDTAWWLVFADGVPLLGGDSQNPTTGAYLWANQPTSASYHPSATYRYSTVQAAQPTVVRTSVGHYVVTLPGMRQHGAALVTPTGSGKAACVVGSIRTDGNPQKIHVHCWLPDGSAADAPFALGFVH
jgi:hypothetical protein